METAIQKAIEGGWRSICSNCQESWIEHKQTRIGNRYCTKYPDMNKAFLDPLFWQALGKSCGWSKFQCPWDSDRNVCIKTCPHKEKWVANALRFYEINLTEGWDQAVAYLEELIK